MFIHVDSCIAKLNGYYKKVEVRKWPNTEVSLINRNWGSSFNLDSRQNIVQGAATLWIDKNTSLIY